MGAALGSAPGVDSRAAAAISLARELLGFHPAAVLIVDRRGTLFASNRRGAELLAAGEVIHIERGCLRALSARESERLLHTLDHEDGGIVLTDCAGKPRLVAVRQAPALAGMLMLYIPCGGTAVNWVELERYFGLTPAECRIAVMLASGRSPAGIARHLGLARSTVKSQARSVYFKTGVDRQAGLILLLAQLPPAPQ